MRPLASRRPIIGIIAASWLALMISEPVMSNTTTSVSSGREPHCAGRFDFALPADLRTGGREESLYLVRVWSEAVSPSADPTEVWTHHTAPLRQAQGSMQPPRLQRDLTLPGVGPAALYRAVATVMPGAPEESKFLAMKPFLGHVVFLEASVSPGREPVAAEVISEIAGAYSPASANGFCVAHGAFLLPPSKNERARSAFEGMGGVSVSLATETVAAPMPASTSEDTADTAAALAADGGRLDVLLRRERAAAGLLGHELRLAVSDKEAVQNGGDPELIYTWIFPGESADGLRPRVRLAASAPAARRTELDSAWEMLLSSLKQRASPH